jgi:hypothetical protein
MIKRLLIVVTSPIWIPVVFALIILFSAIMFLTWPFAYIIKGYDIDRWCDLSWMSENK